MATREELQQQFLDLGVEPNDDVLDKCCEICVLNNIDVEEFVETWMAFSLSHLNGAEPTVENILQMERKEFAQRDRVVTTPKQVTPLRIYNTSQNDMVIDRDDNYCATPKGNASFKGIALQSKSPRTLFSPASYSPDVGTPCSKYKERTNARQVVLSHGVNVDKVNWRANNKDWTPASVTLVLNNESNNSECSTLNLKNRLMKESLPEKVDIFNDHVEHLSKLIVESHNLEEPSDFRHPNSEKFVTVGRIFSCDSRLQQSTVCLEASETFSLGSTIELSLQQLVQPNETCSGLFTGQVVAVEGVNPIGDKIITSKIYSPLPSKPAPSPTIEGPLSVVVAAGPYTQTDNLLYQPLEDLVSYVKEHDPHLAIIVGPVVDSSHPMILDGSLAETYEEFYDKLMTGIMDQLAGCQTQVVVVASARDACQCPVYPTIPTSTGKSMPRLITVPDPCLLNVNGLIIGVSATDILMHLSREEMALSSGDRLGRLSSHLLSQQNFYPLYPPAEDLPFDSALWEELCNMKFTPHILVLPSDLRYFIKNVGECVVVNPERLAKGKVGGYFARLNINSSKDVEDWMPINHISGQILKI